VDDDTVHADEVGRSYLDNFLLFETLDLPYPSRRSM
jgi:hypothetical protein